MKALLLATDFDTEATHSNEKTSVLENTLRKLESAGCDEVIIAAGKSSEILEDLLSKLTFDCLRYTFSIETEYVEKGGSLLHARDLLGEEPFLLLDCATVSDLDFSELMKNGVPHNKLARLVFEPKAAHHTHEYFSLSKDGGISFTFDESFRGDDVIFSGAGVIDPYLIDRYAPDFPRFPLISLLFPTIHQGLACGELHEQPLA